MGDFKNLHRHLVIAVEEEPLCIVDEQFYNDAPQHPVVAVGFNAFKEAVQRIIPFPLLYLLVAVKHEDIGVVALLCAAVRVVAVDLSKFAPRLGSCAHTPERQPDFYVYPAAVRQSARIFQQLVVQLYGVAVISQKLGVKAFAQLDEDFRDGVSVQLEFLD